jgi:hypothetical protein
MGTPNYPKTIGDNINDLRRKAAAAYTSSNTRKALTRIQAAAMDLFGTLTIRNGGSVDIQDGGGITSRGSVQFLNGSNVQQLYFGPIQYGVTPAGIGMLVRRNNGGLVFSLEGTDPTKQFWALRDNAGNIVFSDDAASGQGLATPYVPLTAVPTAWMANRQVSTTSTSFGALYTINGTKQHPKMRFRAIVQSDAGVTGELRVVNPTDGSVLLAVQSIAAGANLNNAYTFVVPGAHQGPLQLDIEMRVASGSGAVGLTVLNVEGIQS